MPGAITYKTKCGLLVRSEIWVISIIPSVYYGGAQHTCITCKLKQCKDCDKVLFKAYGGPSMCEIEDMDEKYKDKKSINKIIRNMNEKYYKEKRELEKGSRHKCPNIVQNYDRAVKKYDLKRCRDANCKNEICVVTGKKRDPE